MERLIGANQSRFDEVQFGANISSRAENIATPRYL